MKDWLLERNKPIRVTTLLVFKPARVMTKIGKGNKEEFGLQSWYSKNGVPVETLEFPKKT